jgi:hypothetical protein
MKHLDIVFLDMPPHHNTSWSKDTLSYLAKTNRLQVVHYEAEPMRYEYFRSLLFGLILQRQFRKFVKAAKMAASLMLLPSRHTGRDHDFGDGQTHLVVMKKSISE